MAIRDSDFQEIYVLTKEKKYQDALELLYDEKTGRINEKYRSDENHAWYLIADLFYKAGNIKEAKAAFIMAITIWEGDIDAYIGLSNILNQQGKYEEASLVLKKGLSITHDERLIYNFANNLFDQVFFKEAIFQYEKISQKNHSLYNLALKNIKKAKKNMKTKK